jgi:hypothetical protein
MTVSRAQSSQHSVPRSAIRRAGSSIKRRMGWNRIFWGAQVLILVFPSLALNRLRKGPSTLLSKP